MIRVKFTDWWKGFEWKLDPTFHDLLFSNFDVREDNDNPNLVIYSVFWNQGKCQGPPEADSPRYKDAIKVCYCGESMPDNIVQNILNKGHYLMYAKRIDHPRYLRISDMERSNFYGCDTSVLDSTDIPTKRAFCSFIFASRNQYREDFTMKLSQYKRVDCLGKRLNNKKNDNLSGRYVGPSSSGLGPSNVEVLKPYKFNVCFENKSLQGYTTEKIWWGFLAKTVSLYWGDPDIHQDFNRESFLCRNDYRSDEEFIEKIKQIDNDDDAYLKMLETHPIVDKSVLDKQKITNFFERIDEDIRNND
jgi:alpha(1,3/1,4) fucosyltransferase